MDNIKLCQSCGGPLGTGDEELQAGTNADGSESGDYCCYCFENGAFKDECKTVEDMIAYCAPLLVEYEMFPDEAAARSALQEQLPPLKRWKAA